MEEDRLVSVTRYTLQQRGEAMADFDAIEPVDDGEILYRRIPVSTGWYQPDKQPPLEPEAFRSITQPAHPPRHPKPSRQPARAGPEGLVAESDSACGRRSRLRFTDVRHLVGIGSFNRDPTGSAWLTACHALPVGSRLNEDAPSSTAGRYSHKFNPKE